MDKETLVIAPEGLSRFYWQGLTGDVVASWMTKHDRLDEIADYSHYLQALYDQFVPQLSENVQINLLGFSQGVATQCRWILDRKPVFHNLILWAGLLPEDLDYLPLQDYFASKQLYLVYGTADPLVKEEYLQWQAGFAKAQGLTYELLTFNGKHTVDRPTLQKLSKRL